MIASQTNRQDSLRPTLRLGPLTLYLFVFFAVPIGVFFVYSFWTVQQWNIVREWNLNNYLAVLTSPVYTRLILRSLTIGLGVALLSVLVVYPLAYAMVFKFGKYRDFILFLLTISLFSNYLVRIFAWRSILSTNGLINWSLMSLGLAAGPEYYLIYSPWGVIITLLNVYLPFATLPIYAALLNVERDLIEAATDLGAGPWRTFVEVTLPLSLSGVKVAFVFIFLLSAGDFVTPELVGGKNGMMIGNAISTQFGIVSNWPLGSAMVYSTIMMFLVIFGGLFLMARAISIVMKRIARLKANNQPTYTVGTSMEGTPLLERYIRKLRLNRVPLLQVYAVLALLFLFLPVIMLIVLSFNNNIAGTFPLQGFTLRWYTEAFEKEIIWPALQNSVIIALGTAIISALLGTPAAFGLTRYSFKFKNTLRGLLTTPMSLPTLLIGIALLAFFAFLGISRSLVTVIIGHVVYCVPYMMLVVSARLEEFDFTVEEAAQDLGATPLQTFRMITFPLIRPTIIGAMLLIFALSFDMFVITFFNIGHGSTLPMVIWSMMRRGINPTLNALGAIITVFSLLLIILAHRFGGVKLGF